MELWADYSSNPMKDLQEQLDTLYLAVREGSPEETLLAYCIQLAAKVGAQIEEQIEHNKKEA